MASVNDLQDAIRRNVERIPEMLKDMLQRVGVELEVYVSMNMQEDSGSPAERVKNARKEPNPTNQLRVVTGDLLRSFTPGKKGYGSRAEFYGSGKAAWVMEVTEDVPYAYIHEFGGQAGAGLKTTIEPRPYMQPALEQFGKEQLADLTLEFYKRVLGF